MRRVGAGVAAAALALPAAVAADSFNPVRLTISVPGHAHLHRPLKVRVRLNADAGVLDSRTGPLYARVRLTRGECGSEFESTRGVVLLNRPLKPQPDPGEAYQGAVTGSGRTARRGVQNVCVFIEDKGDNRVFASDTTDYTVKVS